MTDFLPGLELGGLFYQEAVRPILAAAYPDLDYAAALIGYGSDVIGFDTPISTDHMWGPRLYLFVTEADLPRRDAVFQTLRQQLPVSFRGYSTHFGSPDGIGVRLLQPVERGPVDPLIWIQTPQQFCLDYLGLDPLAGLTARDWLTLPEHKLLSLTAGRVYHDGPGELTAVRAALAYYPADVWLYLLAAQWGRIVEEEAFVGRTGDVGDELGSRVIAGRLVQALMKLAFLLERQYAPYSKWFGSAFARLACAPALTPPLEGALAAEGWGEREGYLSAAYEMAARLHNGLGITAPLDPTVRPYYGRPYLTLFAERFADATRAAIVDEEVRGWPLLGGIDQVSDCVPLVTHASLARKMVVLY
ncbi:MAG: DUF4037 domain-containing protein [Anaerolineae bacterium]|nr:DUF4037 domain-containing protein [Anaerolineae bacterium]